MPLNLRNRLQRIRNEKRSEAGHNNAAVCGSPEPQAVPVFNTGQDAGLFPQSLWVSAGYQVLKRSVKVKLPFCIPAEFSDSLAVIVRDILKYGRIPKPADLVFFDLETTGLSGGAGTLAFLGSFGRLEPDGLVIDQYLLLDYPGEGDFLEAMKKELSQPGQRGIPSLAVSYNGKTFDSQILKNRWLMNAVVPPDYFHADLLHSSRRLWKHLLPDCSQGTIETAVLGLDRSGDIPGALAPEIWFSFLKTGITGDLIGICDHNIRDICGLAALLLLLAQISAAPLETLRSYRYDSEALALLWRETVNYRSGIYAESLHMNMENEKRTAIRLLDRAAADLSPRVLYVHGTDLLKTDPGRGRNMLNSLASCSEKASAELRAGALCALAKDAEWTLKDFEKALAFTESALALTGIRESTRTGLQLRMGRLLEKKESWRRKNEDQITDKNRLQKNI
ncbi:MAG: ribonuclease H-like domain-containing protein [Treponema sp.]|nr:ribonuclease H-like domain-containing protein [Treponema sp.]